ncbi:MAG: hypothetical protein HQM16_18925 [Deltaproteobacteria bacterium]|nr:hypothetical protein [Deltaproteobacteria bacterium]
MIPKPKSQPLLTNKKIRLLIAKGEKQPLAVESPYPSRGQTAWQLLYQTKAGRLFLKKTSKKNHIECCINENSGSLAQREFWCFCLARAVGLPVPELWLLDKETTIQRWLDFPDGHIFSTSLGKMNFLPQNVYECALFDWLTGQVDRHDANYLYDYVNKRIILIDSAHSLLAHTGSLPDYLKMYEFSEVNELQKVIQTKTSEQIKKFKVAKLKKLVPLKDKKESEALANRLQQLQGVNTIRGIISLYRGGI